MCLRNEKPMLLIMHTTRQSGRLRDWSWSEKVPPIFRDPFRFESFAIPREKQEG